MKNAKAYFEKNGFIFGDSAKFNFGKWEHHIIKFDDWEKANKWLETEEYDFREREFISKTEAKKLGYKERIQKKGNDMSEKTKEVKCFDFNDVNNEFNCDECPENIGHDGNGFDHRYPCNQQNCWVTCHLMNNQKKPYRPQAPEKRGFSYCFFTLATLQRVFCFPGYDHKPPEK